MKYIECPNVYKGNEKALFLAGGITGCSNWQSELVKLLEKEDMTILNPRRKDYDLNNPKMEYEQIGWEFEHIKKAKAISFWFPKESICPITLYELGKCSVTHKNLFIGLDREYKRRKDVEIQTKLLRPGIKIVYSLEDLAKQIKNWSKNDKRL